MSIRNATRKGLGMGRLVVACALTAALLAGANALAASGKRTAATKVARVAQVGGTTIRVVTAPTRTVVGVDNADDYGAQDEVFVSCPAGMTAIAGGFTTDDSGVWLNGSSPGPHGTWHLEIHEYNVGESHWTPNVTCA
jgi:hypothetical protein